MSAKTNSQAGTILITGATGLIGTRLCRAFADDFQVVALDIKAPDQAIPGVEFVEFDLLEDDSVRSKLADIHSRFGQNIVSVIHLAAYYDFSGEPSLLYSRLTVEGTRRLLRALHDLNFHVEQFVFSSTLLVMEPNAAGGEISEESPTRAVWPYPQSKLEAEKVIREEHEDIPAVILRIAGVYDGLCHSLPLSQQIARISEKQLESHVFPGDQSHGQALIHLDDLALCFQRVVAHRWKLGPLEVFLVAEPDVMSYGELQDRLGQLIHGQRWSTIEVPKPIAKVGAWVQEKLADENNKPFIRPWMIDLADDHYAASIDHARNVLEWEPRNRLRDMLPYMIDFLKRDPVAFYQLHDLPLPAAGLEPVRMAS